MTYINFHSEEKSENIILIGFMGVGKTTVGQLIANKLDRPFIDIDDEIEKEYQMAITEIFQKYGEEKFRQIEKDMVIYYTAQHRKVISLGGGAFMQEEIKEACLENCTVVHLDISWEVWKKRMGMLIDTRPILHNKTMNEIEDLFYKRRHVYASNHATLITDNYNEEEAAENIINQL